MMVVYLRDSLEFNMIDGELCDCRLTQESSFPHLCVNWQGISGMQTTGRTRARLTSVFVSVGFHIVLLQSDSTTFAC